MIEITKDKINLAKAIIKFHNEVGKVAKNSTNPYFKSKYGDLNAYLEVIKEPLANAGLAIVQMPITNGLKTILMHESGEYLQSECTIPNLAADPQKLGAAVTYLRRYMIASFLGLNAEDTDAQGVIPEPKSQKEVAEEDHVKQARELFRQVKTPSDELKLWISQVDTHNNAAICGGIVKMQKIIKEQ